MKLNIFLSLKKQRKNYLNILIYIIFFCYLSYLIINEPKTPLKIIYMVFLTFFGFFIVLSEILKTLYNKAIINLVEHCDPFEGERLIKMLEKYDILNSYRTSIDIFKLLMLKDMGRPQDVVDYLTNINIKRFSTSYDLLLIYYNSLFYAYGFLGDSKKVKEYYSKVIDLKDKKQGRKKINPLFSWYEITGYYNYYLHKYKESRKAYNLVIVNNMNNHEKVNYFMLMARLALAENNKIDAKKHLQYVITNGNRMSVVTEARELLEHL